MQLFALDETDKYTEPLSVIVDIIINKKITIDIYTNDALVFV